MPKEKAGGVRGWKRKQQALRSVVASFLHQALPNMPTLLASLCSLRPLGTIISGSRDEFL